MKKLLLILIVCQTFTQVFSQGDRTTNYIGKSFLTIADITVLRYNSILGQKIMGSNFIMAKDTRFFVDDITSDGYVISLWSFTDMDGSKARFYESLNGSNSAVSTGGKIPDERFRQTKSQLMWSSSNKLTVADSTGIEGLAYVDSWANHMQFFVSLKDFSSKCQPIYTKLNSFTWGFLTLPIKARLCNSKAPFSFEEKINFGLSFGWKYQFPSTVYTAANFLFGVSVTNVKVGISSQSALSSSLGCMWQYDKFQAGIFTGMDFTDQSLGPWVYQGKPWIGLAIGVSLFGESKTAANTLQSQ